jgi:hypothetical protein
MCQPTIMFIVRDLQIDHTTALEDMWFAHVSHCWSTYFNTAGRIWSYLNHVHSCGKQVESGLYDWVKNVCHQNTYFWPQYVTFNLGNLTILFNLLNSVLLCMKWDNSITLFISLEDVVINLCNWCYVQFPVWRPRHLFPSSQECRLPMVLCWVSL